MNKSITIKKIVKKKYSDIAVGKGCCSGCGCDTLAKPSNAKIIGYSNKEIEEVGEANLGLGCGNPVALSRIKEGDVVLDLGSGAGIDCFLASKKVGEKGKVIGIDMTLAMIAKAKINAKKLNIDNCEFILGDIEKLPVKSNSIDAIITNCVINLAPDKLKVFKEAWRVLKKGGRMYISDIVLLEKLSQKQRSNPDLLAGCVAGALLKEDYLAKLKKANFNIKILGENTNISKQQYNGIALESISIEASK